MIVVLVLLEEDRQFRLGMGRAGKDGHPIFPEANSGHVFFQAVLSEDGEEG